MKKIEKEKTLEQIEHFQGSAMLDLPLKGGSIDQRTWLKLRRHARDKQREEMRKAGARPIGTPSPTAEAELAEAQLGGEIASIADGEVRDHAEAGSSKQSASTSASDAGSEYLRVPKSHSSASSRTAPSATARTRQASHQIEQPSRSTPSPVPFMRLDPQACQLDVVMESLQSLCRPLLQDMSGDVLHESRSGPKPSDEALQFWHHVKYGIYLLKVSAPVRAWETLHKAYQIPAGFVVAQPLDFVKELFTTLSPANTKIYPQARKLLMKHLGSANLEVSNPLSVLIEQLSRDVNAEESSRRAFHSMLGMFTYALGWTHPKTLELRRAMITVLRRASEYEEAGDMADRLLAESQDEFGSGSPQARMAATELAHVNVDRGDYGRASKLSMSVVAHSDLTHDVVGPRFHDSRAVYAMEDLADIHARMGQMEPSLVWLEKAAHDAWDLWKNDVATVHIFDKLDPLLRQYGRADDADWYQQRLVPAC